MIRIAFIYFFIFPLAIYGQIVTTIVGNGNSQNTGDNGYISQATIDYPVGGAFDKWGNYYFTLGNNGHCVRKINPYGIITTVAGISGVSGFSGDNGLAINAHLNNPQWVTIDTSGNLYICDQGNNRVRKINVLSGIITTYVGTGVGGYNGDNIPAISAQLNDPVGLCTDKFGNLYISDYLNNRVRKVNASGIITTIAGTGQSTYNGDGGLADTTNLHGLYWLCTDDTGNVYITERNNARVRKINLAGYINTFAGNGVYGYSGDNGLAINAATVPVAIHFDKFGNLYISDGTNRRIRRIGGPATYTTNNFSVYFSFFCSGTQINIVPSFFSSSLSVKTLYGDGQTTINTFSSTLGYANLNHTYYYPGIYTVKHILYNGNIAVDSIQYSYTHKFCRTIPLQLYFDTNSNCVFDTTVESLLNIPTTIEVDSNNIAIDTVIVTSGMDYLAYGNTGDVYKFKIINTMPALSLTCPINGTILDTLTLGYRSPLFFGFHCIGTSGFDLTEQVSMQTGRHTQQGQIIVNNTYCTPQNGVVTLNISPQYVFTGSSPVPSSVNGNAITWNINNLSSANLANPIIHYTLDVPNPANQSTWLPPGDTIHSSVVITPITGDVNPANNTCIRVDTVKSSFDPNEMDVSPRPYIQAGDQLQYTIQFENTGNDTAQNISVLDTLPNSVNIHTLAMVASTHSCIFSKTWTGSKWVAKFDFPNIKLLDSSHHNQCTGMLVFNIKSTTGLAVGTSIFNHAAIYFDDNPPVITDTIQNIIAIPVTPMVSITANNCNPGLLTTFTATATNGGTAPVYQWKKNGVNVGTNSATYTYTPVYGDSVQCVVTSNAPIAIPATVSSNVIHIPSLLGGFTTVNPTTCGATTGSITLNGVLPNTVYPVSYTKSGIPIGPINYASTALGSLVISGLTAAVYSNIAVTITGGCTTAPINNVYINNPPPPATPIVANSTLALCTGDVIHLSAGSTQSGVIFSWTGPSFSSAAHNVNIANAQSYNAGAYSVIVTDTVTNCASSFATTLVTVNNVVTPTLSVAANDTLCSGAAIVATASANISACSYQWHVNSANVGTNSNTYTYTPANGDHISCSIIATAPSACYSATTANSNERTANVITNIVPTISITGNNIVAAGTPTVYTATTNIVGGTYQWKVNGSNVGSNSNTYTYTPANGDVVTCVIIVPCTGCFSTNSTSSNSINMVVTSLGVATVGAGNAINIYPNPAKNVLHIDNLKEETSYRIVNMLGGVVIQGVLSQGNNEIQLEAIPAGVYMLQLTYANGQREVVRVVKE